MTAQAHKAPNEEADRRKLSKSEQNSGYTLVKDSLEPARVTPNLPLEPACEPLTSTTSAASAVQPVLNGDAAAAVEEKSDQEEEDDISLDSLLQRSREYVTRECRAAAKTPPPQTVKENKGCSPQAETGVQFGFSLRHSPVGLPHPLPPHLPPQQQQQLLSASQPERYAQLPRPELSTSPRPHRRKPRPVSAGNIPFTFPISPADLLARHPGRLGEGDGAATRLSDSFSSGEVDVRGGGDRSRHFGPCGTSPVQEAQTSPIGALRSSPKGQHDHLSAGFRRRSHTLDSHPHNPQGGAEHIDRSQERVPRLMAGVTWMPPTRRVPAAPLNQSYTVTNPSPFLLRHRISPHLGEDAAGSEPEEPARTSDGRLTPSVLKNAAETHFSMTGEFLQVGFPKLGAQKFFWILF